MEDKDLIGQRIKEAREALGISQEQLAARLGIAFQSVQQWEAGKTTPRATRMRKLATVLGKTPTWLQFGVGSTSSKNINDIFKLITSDEFKTQVCSSYAKAMQTSISLNWVALKRSDITLGILADIFYSRLLEEYGLDPSIARAENEDDDEDDIDEVISN
jgi:transcriptional regulator with XRE-family HTH domain